MKSTHNIRQKLINGLAIVLGNALYSLAVALFLEPAGLITGGATGIALAFGRLTGLSVSGFLLVFNLAMLVWGWAVLGRKFALNTLTSSVLSPAFLALFEGLFAGRVLTEDIFLCTIFAGLGIGIALGMVIRAGGIHRRHGHSPAGAAEMVPLAGLADHDALRYRYPAAAGSVQPHRAGAVRHRAGHHPHHRHG